MECMEQRDGANVQPRSRLVDWQRILGRKCREREQPSARDRLPGARERVVVVPGREVRSVARYGALRRSPLALRAQRVSFRRFQELTARRAVRTWTSFPLWHSS